MKSDATAKPVILASTSRYRRELLGKLGLKFDCCAPDIDESPLPHESAPDLAERLATQKAHSMAATYPHHLIIGSDQVAVCDGHLLGKPGNRERAIQQLQRQSGRAVSFYTGISLLDSPSGHIISAVDCCTVYFRHLSDRQIVDYLDREQPFDCAGSFKSEGLGIALFDKIIGEDPNALIGLPLIKLIDLLNDFGVQVLG